MAGQPGGAAEATVSGLIYDYEDLHTPTVRFPRTECPRRFP